MLKVWFGKRDSNPQPSRSKRAAQPIVLFPNVLQITSLQVCASWDLRLRLPQRSLTRALYRFLDWLVRIGLVLPPRIELGHQVIPRPDLPRSRSSMTVGVLVQAPLLPELAVMMTFQIRFDIFGLFRLPKPVDHLGAARTVGVLPKVPNYLTCCRREHRSWWTRRELNPQPLRSQRSALPVELLAQSHSSCEPSMTCRWNPAESNRSHPHCKCRSPPWYMGSLNGPGGLIPSFAWPRLARSHRARKRNRRESNPLRQSRQLRPSSKTSSIWRPSITWPESHRLSYHLTVAIGYSSCSSSSDQYATS